VNDFFFDVELEYMVIFATSLIAKELTKGEVH
jgi:hypothetical protein